MEMTPIKYEEYKGSLSNLTLISFANGPIILNKGAVQMLGLETGSKVNFAYNEKRELFIYKSREGFECKLNTSNQAVFYSKAFCNKVLAEAMINKNSASFRMAKEPVVKNAINYYAIFRSKPYSRK